jgi:hypothetical protein
MLSAVRLVALAASCAVGLIALPATASAVANAAPVCTTINDTVRAGPDAQRLIDLTAACSDADLDPLTYTAADDQSAEHGTLSTGDPTLGGGIYDGPTAYTSSTAYTDSFDVIVSDGTPADDQTLTVNVQVTPDAAPVCTVAPGDDHQTVAHDQVTILIPISCSDANGDPFNVFLHGREGETPGFAGLDDNANATLIKTITVKVAVKTTNPTTGKTVTTTTTVKVKVPR